MAGRPAALWTQVGGGVVDVDGAGDGCGVGEHIGGVAEQDLLAEGGRDFVAIDGGVAGG